MYALFKKTPPPAPSPIFRPDELSNKVPADRYLGLLEYHVKTLHQLSISTGSAPAAGFQLGLGICHMLGAFKAE